MQKQKLTIAIKYFDFALMKATINTDTFVKKQNSDSFSKDTHTIGTTPTHT